LLIPDKQIIGLSLPFLLGQFIVYKVLFDKLFSKRFKLFNEAIRKYITKDTEKLISELNLLKGKKANINAIIDVINLRATIFSEINNLRKKQDNLAMLAKYSFVLFGLSFLLALVVQRPFLFDIIVPTIGILDLLDVIFILSILFAIFLGYKFFALNQLIIKYEREESLSEIIKKIKEDNED